MTVFERIKEISKSRGMSLKELALKAGLSENAIYSWKRKTPRSDSLRKVAKVLDVSIDSLEQSDIKQDKPKHINVDDIINDAAMLTSREHALSDEDRIAIRTMLKAYLESAEGQRRLREYGHIGDKKD